MSNRKRSIFRQIQFCILLFALTCSSLISAQSSYSETIHIKGIVKGDEVKLKGARLKIYVESVLVKDEILSKAKFAIDLPINNWCTLEISDQAYIQKRIVFDTHSENATQHINDFEFEVHLFSEDYFEGSDLSDLDFPVAIVKIDDDKHKLFYEKEYSDYVWQLHKNLAEANAEHIE